MPPIWPICCAWAAWPKRGWPHLWSESSEAVRYRIKLVHLRTGLKAQIHAVLAKEGVTVPVSDLFGKAGQAFLDEIDLAHAYRVRVKSLGDLIELIDQEMAMVEKEIRPYVADDVGYRAVQAIPGVGPVLAAVFVAEIGDVSRFPSPRHLCSWAGLTPTHRESDTTVHRGHITKQGSRLVRWAAVEATIRQGGPTPISACRERIGERRGRNIGRVAAARTLLTLVYYGLRDGEIRCLAEAG